MKQLTHVYHLAEVSNWPLIQRDGLYSASQLLERAGICRLDREQLERKQRLTHIELPNNVQLRDQRPMPPSALATCLVGMSPSEWYAMVNARIFFWIDPKRLNRHRAACASRPQVVLTVDARRLLVAYTAHIALTPINTGNARRRPATRGAATFVPYTTWIASGWASEAAELGTPVRPRSHQPVELTVTRAIPNVMQFVVGVQELAAGQPFTLPDEL